MVRYTRLNNVIVRVSSLIMVLDEMEFRLRTLTCLHVEKRLMKISLLYVSQKKLRVSSFREELSSVVAELSRLMRSSRFRHMRYAATRQKMSFAHIITLSPT